MRFEPYGPFRVPRSQPDQLLLDPSGKSEFWADVESYLPGLKDACGCYVFALRTGGGLMPWYVGKAERQTFAEECFTLDKVRKFTLALNFVGKGTPLMLFYARLTTGRLTLSRPSSSKHADIRFLERTLIGFALARNRDLVNKQETKMLREMVVPGLYNSPKGRLTNDAAAFKQAMGY